MQDLKINTHVTSIESSYFVRGESTGDEEITPAFRPTCLKVERNYEDKIERLASPALPQPFSPSPIGLENFHSLAVLGKGTYATVVLARKADTGAIYAMKVLNKDLLKSQKQRFHIQTERNIMIQVDHPFLIKLSWAFQTETKLYFVLEYCPGGELFNLLQKRRVFTEDQARFYLVEIIMALEALHERDIIYRDLKPENVLLDKDGHIRLTDFGLSKMGITTSRGTFSLCGTPEYLAPEVLFRSGHGKAADWWTLGALLFEMLTGLPPFYASKREDLFSKIKFAAPPLPSTLSMEAADLIRSLLVKDPESRLGGGLNGVADLKDHPFLSGVNWGAHYRKEITPPFVPVIKTDLDLSNFSPEFTQMSLETRQADPFAVQEYPDFDQFSFNEENFNTVDESKCTAELEPFSLMETLKSTTA
jgi:serine/threonine protein kinase